MKPNQGKPTPVAVSPSASLPLTEEQVKRAQDDARTVLIGRQRERATELLAKASTREEVLAAVHQAGAEIAESEMSVNRMDYQPTRSHDEQAHLANLDVLNMELQQTERQRQADILARQAADMARRNADVDFVAQEMKLHRATRYFSSGE